MKNCQLWTNMDYFWEIGTNCLKGEFMGLRDQVAALLLGLCPQTPVIGSAARARPVPLRKSIPVSAAPLPFRPGNPALCGSCPLVTPYYCRLGDLLCYNCMLYSCYHFVCMHVYFVFSLFSGLFSFVDFPSVLWHCWLGLLTCKNRLPYNLYCVGGDVKHCTIQSKLPQVITAGTGTLLFWSDLWLLVWH